MNQLFWPSCRCCLGALCCGRQPKVLKELVGRDAFLKMYMQVIRPSNIFLDMKAGLKKSWSLGKDWETTCLALKVAGVGISGEVSRITSGGPLQTKRITEFNTISLLHL